jgi:hypothetical protein
MRCLEPALTEWLKTPSINSVGAYAIMPLPLKSTTVGLLAGYPVTDGCG